jgi:Polyketide cyclase / dehydrase and lipid transport
VYEANRKFGYRVDKPFPMNQVFLLEPSGSGTKLTFTIEGTPGGFFGVVAPLLKRTVKGQMTADLGTLKARLEARA